MEYAREKIEIQLSLRKEGKKCIIEVCNEADKLQEGELDIYFKRFYHTDTSHDSQTGERIIITAKI